MKNYLFIINNTKINETTRNKSFWQSTSIPQPTDMPDFETKENNWFFIEKLTQAEFFVT